MLTVALLSSSVAFAAEPSPLDGTARVLADLKMAHELTVKETGDGDKRVIKLAPEPGAEKRYQLVTAQDLSMTMTGPDGSETPMPQMPGMNPTVVFDISHEVGQPVAEGLVPVAVTYTDVNLDGDVPPAVATQMMQGLAPMKGLGFRLLVDPGEGVPVQADVSTSDQQLFEITQSLADQFLTSLPRFPTEPVGVGAVWTVDMTMNVGGMPLTSHQTITVTELTDDHVVTKVSFDLKRGDAPMQLPGLPPGAEVDMQQFEGDGEGEMRTDLHTLVSTGTMRTVLDLKMAVGAAGQPTMTMAMNTTQTLTMRDAE